MRATKREKELRYQLGVLIILKGYITPRCKPLMWGDALPGIEAMRAEAKARYEAMPPELRENRERAWAEVRGEVSQVSQELRSLEEKRGIGVSIQVASKAEA